MPILVALAVAVLVAGLVFGLAAERNPSADLATVGEHAGEHGAAVAANHPWFKRFVLQRRDPSKETGLLLTIAVMGITIAIVGIGALLEMINKDSGFAKLDDSVARFGARHATEDTTTFLKAVTEFGATHTAWALVVLVGIQQYVQHRRKAIPLFLIAVVGSTTLVNNIVKVIVDRQRPDIARLVGAFGSSFPSGHSATAAAIWAALALLYGRGRSRAVRASLAGAAAAIAIAVASSRVLLGVHWLTDVTAGVLMGWGCFALCSIAFGGRVMHFGEPVEIAQRVIADNEAPQPMAGAR